MARPQQYNKEIVTNQAMHLFWRKGYQATPVSDLVKVTGVRPGSLYSAFGNKEGLLFAALEHYTDEVEVSFRNHFNSCLTAREGVETLLQGIISEATASEPSADGCLLVNTLLEMSGLNENVCKLVNQQLARVEQCFKEVFDRARSEHDLPEGADSEKMAVFLMGVIWSLKVMSRLSPEPWRMQALMTPALKGMFGRQAICC